MKLPAKTDSLGRFSIETRAPVVVFRKSGFQSKYWRIGNTGDNLEIVLSGPAPQMKPCTAASRCVSLKYFGSAFCVPGIKGVHVSKQGNDVDYGKRSFWIQSRDGKVGVGHGAGPMWGSGFPFDDDVWSATEYSEAAYQDQEGYLITDARGRDTEGKYWRVLGHAFETISYRDLSEQDARQLNRVIDSVCVQPTRFGLDRH